MNLKEKGKIYKMPTANKSQIKEINKDELQKN